MPKKKQEKTPSKQKKENKPKGETGYVKTEDDQEHTEAVNVVQEIVKEPVEQVADLKELKLDRNKIELIKRTIAKNATNDELLMFINVCKQMGLSPFLRQVHLVKRYDSKEKKEVAAVQVGIDGFRSIAEDTNAYAGNSDPDFTGMKEREAKVNKYENGKKITTTETYQAPEKATVVVKKIVQGLVCEFQATARWDEFYPGDTVGFMWRSKPHVMLGKCAEAQALRKAFPKVLGTIYVPEEMQKAEGTGKIDQSSEEKMKVAMQMISKDNDVERMEKWYKKVEKSDLYNEQQKEQLKKSIEERKKEIASQLDEQD